MARLPQMFGAVRRKPVAQPDVPLEVKLWQQTHEDARRYQSAAQANSASARGGVRPATARLASEQYAYVRWLMGIDDYWLTMRQTIHPRGSFDRLPHQKLKGEIA